MGCVTCGVKKMRVGQRGFFFVLQDANLESPLQSPPPTPVQGVGGRSRGGGPVHCFQACRVERMQCSCFRKSLKKIRGTQQLFCVSHRSYMHFGNRWARVCGGCACSETKPIQRQWGYKKILIRIRGWIAPFLGFAP